MDIKLSKRMKKVADMASGDVVADIGCDHGFVSMYLVKHGGFKKAIAIDSKKGPLDNARRHIKEKGLSDKVELRLSDGFLALSENEADCAVIAGVGGLLMTSILKRGKKHTDNGIRLILQPQSDCDVVRSYLQTINYHIVDEAVLIDEDKYYFVIKAEKNVESERRLYTDAELMYGPVLLSKKDELLKEYIEKKYKTKNELFSLLCMVNTNSARDKCYALKSDIDILMEAKTFYEK